MSSIVVCGGSVVGLSVALMLARDGHDVTVLESDPDDVPAMPVDAWSGWRRKGVAQFHQPHNLFARFRQVCDEELPGMTQRLRAAGCVWVDFLDTPPPTLAERWSRRPEDDALRFVTGRRPVVEATIASTAADEPRVRIRRGVRVAALLSGPSALPGTPHVTGVRTTAGEELRTDLVVDATGRRSPGTDWLTGIGARPPAVQAEDRGFVYYTRFFRGTERPPRLGRALTAMGSISLLTLDGDDDTWSVTVFGRSDDAPIKALRNPERFGRVVGACPLQAHWLAGTPITDVLPMAGIMDRYRRFTVDGRPVVTGFAAVGDAWACTNPSAGRGISIGLAHAQLLRRTVRALLDDPVEFAQAWGRGHRGVRGAVRQAPDRVRQRPHRRDGRDPPRPRAAAPGPGDRPLPHRRHVRPGRVPRPGREPALRHRAGGRPRPAQGEGRDGHLRRGARTRHTRPGPAAVAVAAELTAVAALSAPSSAWRRPRNDHVK